MRLSQLLLVSGCLYAALPCAEGFADVKDGIAAYRLGDYRSAFKAFQKGDQDGDPEGSYLLGLLYMLGEGVERNPKKGFAYLRKASEKGNPFAPYALGSAYFYGNSVKRDFKEAAKWYKMGAKRGDYRAGHMLGRMYHQGIGVERNPIEGFAWCYTGSHASIADHNCLECLIAIVPSFTSQDLKDAEEKGEEYYMRYMAPNVRTVDVLSKRFEEPRQ